MKQIQTVRSLLQFYFRSFLPIYHLFADFSHCVTSRLHSISLHGLAALQSPLLVWILKSTLKHLSSIILWGILTFYNKSLNNQKKEICNSESKASLSFKWMSLYLGPKAVKFFSFSTRSASHKLLISLTCLTVDGIAPLVRSFFHFPRGKSFS